MTVFRKFITSAAMLGSAAAIAAPAFAQQDGHHMEDHHGHRVDAHAPIGVMADHMHEKGEFMISYRYGTMHMEGNRIDGDDVSPETIATTIPNRFFGAPMQPPTLRVVPVEMDMQMHMVGAMYAPTDWLTLMVMGNYTIKEMDHITFAGGMGTTRLGTFTTKAKGWGDTELSGLFRVWETDNHRLQANIGVSLPTGSNEKTDDVLTPMGMMPTLRLPYPMQLGSGTFDALPGVTYTGHGDKIAWGAQFQSTIRLGENEEDYSLGNVYKTTAWASYAWADWVSTSFRLAAETTGKIDGIDAAIVAPVQTANPDFQGGTRMDALFGVNLLGQQGHVAGHRLALEAGVPVYQDLNGPQMKSDWRLTIGYQKAF